MNEQRELAAERMLNFGDQAVACLDRMRVYTIDLADDAAEDIISGETHRISADIYELKSRIRALVAALHTAE